MKRKYFMAALALVLLGGGFAVYRSVTAHPSVLGISNTPDSRNEQRRSKLADLKTALSKYLAEHNNKLPVTLPATQTAVCSSSPANCKGTKFVDLNFLVGSGYMLAIPNDPVGGTGRYNSGFEIYREKSGRVHIVAVRAENATIAEQF